MEREDVFIIRVKLNDGDPRVCDYCNKFLVNEEGIAEEKCFSTEYGLMCRECLGSIEPITYYDQGENVKNESWYKG